MNWYPLCFQPLFRRYLWGGRRLGEVLQKPIGPGEDYAESWEVVDHGRDQSIVANGPLAGKTLGELVAEFPEQLLGLSHPIDRFPLLFKFLDCNRNLSVQVHPNDAQGARLDPPDLGKTEAWVILDALPGSKIYAGLKRGFDRNALAREVARGTTELCLHSFEPKPGDCVFIPAGTVHALGAGLLVAEIQQASDTTFRLFDWNRVDASGLPRPLHLEASLDTIDYVRGPIEPQLPQRTSRDSVTRLVACDKFVLERWVFSDPELLECRGRFHLVVVLNGNLRIKTDSASLTLGRGQVSLLPAALDRVQLDPSLTTTLLDIYLPDTD